MERPCKSLGSDNYNALDALAFKTASSLPRVSSVSFTMRKPLFPWLLILYSLFVFILFPIDEVLVCGRCLEDQKSLLLQLNQSLSFNTGDIPVGLKRASWEKNTDCCSWKGVTCDGDSGHVIGLNLSNEYISGGIDNPSGSLFNLRYLQSLNLAYNHFNYTSIPSELINLVNLTDLNLSNAGFAGQVPIGISRLTRLVSLDLSTTPTGRTPLRLEKPDLITLVWNLSGLKTLNLDGVKISGNGSQWVRPVLSSAFSNLQVLSLSNCYLSGLLNSSLSILLDQLDSLDLSYNNLTGPIPPLPESVTQVNLAHNSLTGPLLNSHWKRLVKLVNLDLSNNSLNGTIPLSLFTLPTLKKLQLGQNQFAGQLMEFPTSCMLDTLDLSSNKLEGAIPLSIFELQHLTVLSLSFNNFSGTIELDEMIQKLQNLTSLDLSYNSLLINTSVCNSNTSFPQLDTLKLASCKLKYFPDFLRESQSNLRLLDLSNNQIHGQIPTWVWQIGGLLYLNLSFNFLNYLKPMPTSFGLPGVLDLHSNLFRGPIPFPLPYTEYLDLSNNSFQSIIPYDINLTIYLSVFFSLSSNNLTGEIPQSICNAAYLQVLDLSNNSLSGTIPSCLANMSTLAVLKLQNNHFAGQVPQTFPNQCSLRTLDLSWNKLEGPLSRALAKCNQLEVLNLGNNQINGSFPLWLGSSTDLRVLILRSNRFSGAIIGEGTNCTLPKLQIVDLSSNNFTGNLPSECLMKWTAMISNKDETQPKNRVGFLYTEGNFGYFTTGLFEFKYYEQDTVTITSKGQETELVKILTIYTSIDLSNNGFQGKIPYVIGNLTSLYFLNLSQNALTGRIPSSLGNLKQLESLDLSCNKLEGEIPQQLTSLTFLSILNLSWNNLTGMIPMGSQFQTFTETSFGGNEGLCGAPLSRNCTHIEPILPPPATWSQKRQLFGYDWEIVLSGFVMGFGGGAGVVVAFVLFSSRGRKWLMARL